MTQTRKIRSQLLKMSQELKLQQNRLNFYRQSFQESLGDKRMVFLAMLPIFYGGWRLIRHAGLVNFVKSGMRILALSFMTNIRSRAITNLRNVLSEHLNAKN